MTTKTTGLALGAIGVFLWFMPWAAWQQEFMGQTQTVFQAGHHVGGLAYLVLVAAALYAFAAWQKQRPLQLVSAFLWLGVCLVFFVQGNNIAWGLFALLAVGATCLWVAFRTDGRTPGADGQMETHLQ